MWNDIVKKQNAFLIFVFASWLPLIIVLLYNLPHSGYGCLPTKKMWAYFNLIGSYESNFILVHLHSFSCVCRHAYRFNPFVTSGTYMSHSKSLFKSTEITVSHFFSMLPSTLKYLHSVEPVRMQCAMLQSSIAHSIICTRLFRGKIRSDWFNGIEILQGRWQHGEKVGYCYHSGLEKTLCKWDI